MDIVELKYCGILSVRLDRFKVKSNNPYRANCKCPLCGDSAKSKSKTRGWLLEKSNKIFYYCHNCGASHPFWRFLKIYDLAIYNEYVIDTQLEKYSTEPVVEKEVSPIDTLVHSPPEFKKSGSPLLRIRKVSQLKSDHPVRKYVEKRRIPHNQHYRIYFAPKFETWVNSIIPEKLDDKNPKPRLILPFINEKGEMFGFQGRAFDKSSLRYITIMIDESQAKIFGLDKVDFTKKYYIVEGPIDSLFIPNAIAMAGADGNLNALSHIENAVFVFDNEPRNPDIIRRMNSLVDAGHKICVWPQKSVDIKDINDMIISGCTAQTVQETIDQNTFYGLEAKLAIAAWRKI